MADNIRGVIKYANEEEAIVGVSSLISGGGTSLIVAPGTGPVVTIKGLADGVNTTVVDNGTTVQINTAGAAITTLSSAGGTTLVTDGTGPTLTVKGFVSGVNTTLVDNGTTLQLNVLNSPVYSVALVTARWHDAGFGGIPRVLDMTQLFRFIRFTQPGLPTFVHMTAIDRSTTDFHCDSREFRHVDGALNPAALVPAGFIPTNTINSVAIQGRITIGVTIQLQMTIFGAVTGTPGFVQIDPEKANSGTPPNLATFISTNAILDPLGESAHMHAFSYTYTLA